MAKRAKDIKDKASPLHGDTGRFDALATPLPVTPTKAPDPKKQRVKDDSPKSASNDDILNAVLGLLGRYTRFATLEEKLSSNMNAITEVCSHLKAVEMQVQSNKKEIKGMPEQIAKLQQRCDDAERYSRRWNVRLYGMKETPEENVRAEVTKLFSVLAPEDKEKMGFLIDMVHRVGAPRDNSNRPIIIQFNMRSYRSKIWKIVVTTAS